MAGAFAFIFGVILITKYEMICIRKTLKFNCGN